MDIKNKRKRWLLPSEKALQDNPKDNDERDMEPWRSRQTDKGNSSGATGPSIIDESDQSYPSDSNGENYLLRYLGRPGMDYDTTSNPES